MGSGGAQILPAVLPPAGDGVVERGRWALLALGVVRYSSRRLVLLDPTKPEGAKEVAKGILVAFFWSPDSQKIAYFLPSTGNQQGNAPQLIQANTGIKLDLQIYDLASGKITQASTFAPTDSFLQVFPYFDQYQRSGTIWSPDSKNLVLAGLDDKQGASIFVVNADGSKIQRIAGGNLAFWSWK